GGWIFSLFGVVAAGTVGSLLTSIVGAVVLLWIVSLFTSRIRKKIVK
ncbi:MAG: GlsB/YeaQ/YmgE family stress response membrane protein, partial [Alistipes sp.]|nr:GlsB/YeaQ/YmgE family stress response membrane protein [Alistipes sp.]